MPSPARVRAYHSTTSHALIIPPCSPCSWLLQTLRSSPRLSRRCPRARRRHPRASKPRSGSTACSTRRPGAARPCSPASRSTARSDGRPAEDSTEVLVWYAPDAIYFGIRAFERHGAAAVRATLANRDNIDADDRVQLLLDTYADHRRALLFAVNPLGRPGGRHLERRRGGLRGRPAGGRPIRRDHRPEPRLRVRVPRAASRRTATKWRCGFPSRACAISRPTPRPGDSRSTASPSTRATRTPGRPPCAPTPASSSSRAGSRDSPDCTAAWSWTSPPSSPPRSTARPRRRDLRVHDRARRGRHAALGRHREPQPHGGGQPRLLPG